MVANSARAMDLASEKLMSGNRPILNAFFLRLPGSRYCTCQDITHSEIHLSDLSPILRTQNVQAKLIPGPNLGNCPHNQNGPTGRHCNLANELRVRACGHRTVGRDPLRLFTGSWGSFRLDEGRPPLVGSTRKFRHRSSDSIALAIVGQCGW